jgi:hypothetical protein
MSARGTNLTFVSAAGAALALTAAAAAPSLAAGDVRATFSYGCGNGVTPTAGYSVAAPPARMAAGQTVKLGTTATFSLDPPNSGLVAVVLHAVSVDGKLRTKPSNKAVGLHLKIAKTVLGNAPLGATTAKMSGKTLLRSTHVGTFTLRLGDLGLLHLQGYDGTGAATKSLDFPSADGNFSTCTNPAGKTALESAGTAATVKVGKDSTSTKVRAAFLPAKHRISTTTKVRSHFGIRARGKVRIRLKRGATTIRTLTVKLNRKGLAKTAFRVTRAGRYTVRSRYDGRTNLRRSAGSTRLRAA